MLHSALGFGGCFSAPHRAAALAGCDVLKAGGTAIEAMVAAAATIAVVYPHMNGIGGDAFWLAWDEGGGSLTGLNGSGRAPRAVDAAALRSAGHVALPHRGPLTITVPGAVRSWADMHARFGRLPAARLLAPAIELAGDGFPAWPGLVAAVESTAALLGDAPWAAGFGETFRPAGRAWRVGERIRLAALATTLEHLAADGLDAFYGGELGRRQATFLASAGAPMDAEDLAGHASTWTEPIEAAYRGVRVATHPPNSSGVVALELLAILDRFAPTDAAGLAAGRGPDAAWAHLGIEAAKLAMADRDRWLTDPDAADVPVARLLDPVSVAGLAARIDPGHAQPASPGGPRGGGTVFLAAVDGDGNAVSLIESNYMGFGSGVVDPETGIHYQNRGAYFSLDPGQANVLAPGKRTLHTLLPAMLFRAGERRPWIVLGSMGGDAQPQVLAQLVSGIVDGGLDVAAAVSAPRWFVAPPDHFLPPVVVRLAARFAEEVAPGLAGRGHPVTRIGAFDALVGHAHAIELVDGGPAAGGTLAAATDPRSEGLPAVR
jgi:gamma-glutamyltranspeptidase/glutathione hydrolase